MPRDTRGSGGGSAKIEDRARFQHMIDAANDALEYCRDRERAELESDGMLAHALAHCLMVIGEAAYQTSEEGRLRGVDVPWDVIAGMRHRIVHAYYDLDHEVIWSTVRDDLKPLIAALEKALADWPEPPPA